MKRKHGLGRWRWLVLLCWLFLGTFPSSVGILRPECTLKHVPVVKEARDKARHATDCVKSPDLKTVKTIHKTWKNDSDYSHGGLDDFCLHTQISDSKGMHESRQRMYRGIGSDFWVLQKLQRGNAWSFQRNGPLETVNMNWNKAATMYEEFMAQAAIYEDWMARYERNITMWEEIKAIYKEKKLNVNGSTEFAAVKEWMELERGLIGEHDQYTSLFPTLAPFTPKLATDSTEQVFFKWITTDWSKPSSTSIVYYQYYELIEYLASMEPARFMDKVDPVFNYDFKTRRNFEISYGKTHPDTKLYENTEAVRQYVETNTKANTEWYDWFTRKHISPMRDVYNNYRRWMILRYQIDGRRVIHHGYSREEQQRRQKIVDSCRDHRDAVRAHFADLEYLLRNIKSSPVTPEPLAPNPYFVQVSAITVNGAVLKNFLHIRVFMNQSVSDAKPHLHSEDELEGKTQGRMKAVLIIVKDQEGFPVGDFSRPVPCDRTCDAYSGPIKKHNTYRNDLPCVYTPPTANQHPGLFVWPGSDQENSTDIDYEGVRELHATWSFSQDSCNFVTELHIQTLILEDLELELPGTDRFLKCDSKLKQPDCVSLKNIDTCEHTFKNAFDIDGFTDRLKTRSECNVHNEVNKTGGLLDYLKQACSHVGRGHLFGWTARYNVIHPTLHSLGAPDYVNIQELREQEQRGTHINCHVPLGAIKEFTTGNVPKRMDAIPSMAPYFLELMAEFGHELQDMDILYYGTHYKGRLQCREPKLNADASAVAIAKLKETLAPPPVKKFMQKSGIRCPCPALATTPDPETATVDPSRLHGRLLHASHMALAWMLLLPLSIFVVRYYKETFALVFCVQEYWWFAWHVGLLFGAVAFVLGGILAVRTRRSGVDLVWNERILVHQVFGVFSITLFYVQILTGFFRSEDPIKRMRQIFLHWILGMLNQASAVLAIIMMGFVKESGMACNALYTAAAWTVFYILMFVIMEVHMRANDKHLNLDPPRSYLPPPMKRLFGRDAPHRNFRIVMLGIFVIGMIVFYILMAYFIWHSGGVSCQNEKEAAEQAAEAAEGGYEDYYE